MIRHNVGVRIEESIYLKKVDEDFFLDEQPSKSRTKCPKSRGLKNSWEGLAKDILLAGNIEMGRLDPDSPAIGHALQRLQGNTKYAGKLLVELTGLQMTARTLFNQFPFAYDPSDADARQYIIRCEEARRELRLSE